MAARIRLPAVEVTVSDETADGLSAGLDLADKVHKVVRAARDADLGGALARAVSAVRGRSRRATR
jgi:hypothetical protein